jgi:hypothetical protein
MGPLDGTRWNGTLQENPLWGIPGGAPGGNSLERIPWMGPPHRDHLEGTTRTEPPGGDCLEVTPLRAPSEGNLLMRPTR